MVEDRGVKYEWCWGWGFTRLPLGQLNAQSFLSPSFKMRATIYKYKFIMEVKQIKKKHILYNFPATLSPDWILWWGKINIIRKRIFESPTCQTPHVRNELNNKVFHKQQMGAAVVFIETLQQQLLYIRPG